MRDRSPHRFWDYSASCGSGLSIRVDQRGYGLRRKRKCKRQGCRQGEIKKSPCFNQSRGLAVTMCPLWVRTDDGRRMGQLRRRLDNCAASRARADHLPSTEFLVSYLARQGIGVSRDAEPVIDVRCPRAVGAAPAERSGDVRLRACSRNPRDNSGSHLPWRRRALSGAARHGEPGILEDASANGFRAHAGVLHDHAQGPSPPQ